MKQKNPDELAHELMHKMLDDINIEIPKTSWWGKLKSVFAVSLIISLAALIVIGSLLVLPLLIVIGIGFALFVGCRIWMNETKR